MSSKISRPDDKAVASATSAGSKYRIEIDRNICIGATSCVALAGSTFRLGDDNKVLIVSGTWDKDELILAAAQSCPVFAIKIFDRESGRQIFPETK